MGEAVSCGWVGLSVAGVLFSSRSSGRGVHGAVADGVEQLGDKLVCRS